VGVAIDTERGLCYWTQKGGAGATNGSLMCCSLDSAPAKGGAVTVLREGLETVVHICLRQSTKELLIVLRDPGEIVSYTLAEDGLRILSESVIVSGLKSACCIEDDSDRLLYTEIANGGCVWASNKDGSDPRVIRKGFTVLGKGLSATTGVCAIELSSQGKDQSASSISCVCTTELSSQAKDQSVRSILAATASKLKSGALILAVAAVAVAAARIW